MDPRGATELSGYGLILEDGFLRHTGEQYLPEELVVPSGVVAIDNYCFARSPNLKRVVLPATLREIGVGAFSDCALLEDVNIPAGIDRLRKLVFAGAKHLGAITVPDGVTSIGEWAFRDCTNLRNITLPASITEICAESFLGCPNLAINAPAGSYAEGYASSLWSQA